MSKDLKDRAESTSEQLHWDKKWKSLKRIHSVFSFVLSVSYAGAAWFIFAGFMRLTTEISKSLGAEMPPPGEIILALVAVILILIGGVLLMSIPDKIFLRQRVKIDKRS